MKAKFTAFGFLSGFRFVTNARVGDRFVLAALPRIKMAMVEMYPNPTLLPVKEFVFECTRFDGDNCAIYELVEF